MQIIFKQARQGRMRQRAYELSLQWNGGIFFFLSGKRPNFFPFFSDEGFPKIFLLFSKHLPIRFCWKINCTLVLHYFYRCTQTLLLNNANSAFNKLELKLKLKLSLAKRRRQFAMLLNNVFSGWREFSAVFWRKANKLFPSWLQCITMRENMGYILCKIWTSCR